MYIYKFNLFICISLRFATEVIYILNFSFNIINSYLFRNWESMIPLCSHPVLGEDITALVFNPMNWCQICAVKSKALTIWNVERCGNYHLMNPR